ncbi:HNH endonuclease signature motif containing protein [Halobacterium sp. R2-5]|uniref:HNH endonuclease n=1 Tax=Halobacterium sp. R2-5 TaxID=2715751 RepID=UPI0014207C63|nr:HNH endonuclease signature motif containing protein [Halobacterium sp. R2-5]NIC00248.1 HNH endonuclease [Halobacterium sp. R2-5]
MAETTARSNGESSGDRTGSGGSDRTGLCECNETVDPDTRQEVLEEYKHRCQACGRRGPEEGGLATIHVHHIDRHIDDMDEHAMENLTLMCRPCHSWLHQQATPGESPVTITDADRNVLLPQDVEVLQFLASHGPTRTGDIASGMTADLSVSAVRERLWVLMGLDNRVESRDRQIVDKDVETGEWGLTDQIENSARGHIPDDQQLLLQRMEDEQVRRALDRGCERRAVMDVLGISRRSTFNKIKRAYAYDFPLDAFSRGGRPTSETRNQGRDVERDTPKDDAGDEQQRLNDVAGEDLGRVETWGNSDTTTGPSGLAAGSGDDESASGCPETEAVSPNLTEELLRELQSAIEALEAADEAL